MDISQLPSVRGFKQKTPTGETRPRGQPRKIIATVPIPAVVDTSSILADSDLLKSSFALVDPREKKLVTKKSAEESIVILKKIMSATKVSSKIYKPSLYEEVISDLMYTRQ